MQRNFHTFQPLLYQVATAGLDAGDVAYPVRAVFGHDDNVNVRFAKVIGVDWEDRLVALESSGPVPFDSLIIASGATVGYFGVEGASEFSFPLYTLTDARTLRDHVLRRLEQADADPGSAPAGPLTFVVVGGGPTGVEVAGAMAELLDLADLMFVMVAASGLMATAQIAPIAKDSGSPTKRWICCSSPPRR